MKKYIEFIPNIIKYYYTEKRTSDLMNLIGFAGIVTIFAIYFVGFLSILTR